MKTGISLLVLLALSQTGYGIGHPHNLFAARKAMLVWKAEQQRSKPSVSQRIARLTKRYSYTFSPCFSQMPHVRE
ncbi:hypothetical protein [Fibrella aquatica]|uniref:hypothetical protein n=1 Tax=Fibrella aquatica TaxID=3242487 RepID=UPI003522F5EE